MVAMKTLATEKYLGEVNKGIISLEVSIQRGADQWIIVQQSKLVESMLEGEPIPPIFMADFEGKKVVYDGLQRTTALRKFYNDEFALKGVDERLCGKTFSQLEEDDKKKFLEYELFLSDAGEVSEEKLVRLFLNANSGTALIKTQITRGNLGITNADWARKMCQHPLFTKEAEFTSKQMKDDAPLQCLLQGIMLIHGCIGNEFGERYEWKGIASNHVDKYTKEVFSNASKKDLREYEEVIEYLDVIEVKHNCKKTFIPCLIVLGKYAMLAGISKEEFNPYAQYLINNMPEEYEQYKGAGSVSKAKVVGKLKALINHFHQKFSEVKRVEINLETTNPKKTTKTAVDSASNGDSKSSSRNGVEAQPDDVVLEKSAEQSEADAATEDAVVRSEVEETVNTAFADIENVETSADTVVETEDDKNSDVVSVSPEADTDSSSDVSSRAEADVTEIKPLV